VPRLLKPAPDETVKGIAQPRTELLPDWSRMGSGHGVPEHACPEVEVWRAHGALEHKVGDAETDRFVSGNHCIVLVEHVNRLNEPVTG